MLANDDTTTWAQGLQTVATLDRWREEHPLAYQLLRREGALQAAVYIKQEFSPFDAEPDDEGVFDYAPPPFDLMDEEDIVDAVFPLDDDLYTETFQVLTGKGQAQQRAKVTPIARVWQPTQKALPKPGPKVRVVQEQANHPILAVKARPSPDGWKFVVPKTLAATLAGWYAGRPHTEWSALCTVDVHWTRSGTGVFVFKEAFFCDAGRDTGGHSTVPHDWEAKLINRLLDENREDDVPKLFGHVHSHNTMGAFWSTQDDLMVGQRLDDMAANRARTQGIAVSLVIGTDLTIRGRLDWFKRGDDGALTYHTWDPVPVAIKFPDMVPLKEVLYSTKTNKGTTQALTGQWWSGDDDDDYGSYYYKRWQVNTP